MIGFTSTHAAASSKPWTRTFGAILCRWRLTASRLVSTPRPPAEHPAKSMRTGPGWDPSPFSRTMPVMAADTMREPRKANPKVESEAPASPNHESEEQYLTKTIEALAKGFCLGTVLFGFLTRERRGVRWGEARERRVSRGGDNGRSRCFW